MIQRTENFNINITPREIENEIWLMDSTQQTDLILAMAQRFKNEGWNVLMQLSYMSDDFNKLLSEEEKKYAIRFFESIVEYLKGE